MDDHVVPEDVAAMAASVGGRPIAWHLAEGIVTIVMEDGRKLRFRKKPSMTVVHKIIGAPAGESPAGKEKKKRSQ